MYPLDIVQKYACDKFDDDPIIDSTVVNALLEELHKIYKIISIRIINIRTFTFMELLVKYINLKIYFYVQGEFNLFSKNFKKIKYLTLDSLKASDVTLYGGAVSRIFSSDDPEIYRQLDSIKYAEQSDFMDEEFIKKHNIKAIRIFTKLNVSPNLIFTMYSANPKSNFLWLIYNPSIDVFNKNTSVNSLITNSMLEHTYTNLEFSVITQDIINKLQFVNTKILKVNINKVIKKKYDIAPLLKNANILSLHVHGVKIRENYNEALEHNTTLLRCDISTCNNYFNSLQKPEFLKRIEYIDSIIARNRENYYRQRM